MEQHPIQPSRVITILIITLGYKNLRLKAVSLP